MQIKLRKLKLTNFKGIRSQEITFNQTTNIYGDNAVGKTTIFDAFTWCLFGKDSKDRKDFEIKTLDENNIVIPQIEHEVEAELQVDQQVINVRRVLSEKWTKRRGDTTTEFTGNETTYFWNDVPMKQSEFQAKVSGLVDENLFKLLTSPLFFNVNLKWQDRRVVLFSLAEKVEDVSILDEIATIENKTQIGIITNMLNMGKSLVEYKKEIGSKKKKLKDELDNIPVRVSEVQNGKPWPVDYNQIQSSINSLKADIQVIEEEKNSIVTASQAKNKIILDKQSELNGLKSQLQQLNFDLGKDKTTNVNLLSSQINELEYATTTSKNEIDQLNKRIAAINLEIVRLTNENAQLTEKWHAKNVEEFVITDDKTTCPSCKRKLDDSDIDNITETLQTNFNNSKAAELSSITEKGKTNNKVKESYESEVKGFTNRINEINAIIENNTKVIAEKTKECEELNSKAIQPTEEIIALEAQIQNFVIPNSDPTDFTELNKRRAEIDSKIDEYNKQLGTKDLIEKANLRIKELGEQESKLAQELADLENQEYVIDAFNKNKIEAMERSVNQKFSNVRFKLFETQINGGEVECCEALVNTNGSWVPFTNGNTAGQLNAGVDIINTLCKHHGITAPIFIDNREAVNQLIPTDSQVVNLIVSLDKTLKIN